MQHTAANADRAAARRAFTLVELMIVLTIISIMATMCLPTFQRAIEQSEADIAAANLRAIWAAERLYWLENHAYAGDDPPPGRCALKKLQDLGLLDPNLPIVGVPVVPGGYTYGVDAADATTFRATATRSDLGSFSIDQDGTISGTVTFSGKEIKPGFE